MCPDPIPTPPLIDRAWLEAEERRLLDPAASFSGDSWQRPQAEAPDPHRTCFVRDRDRVLHSAAFRRLKAKTQVFVIDQDDFYRTRLTHTLEVSQLARFLARVLRLNAELAEVLALVHDIGHPPFGHEGERVLNRHAGVPFDHNSHALRIVDVLDSPYHDRQGLNLTHTVRRMILKHGGQAGRGAAPTTGLVLEAQVTDLADSLAYQHHDIEDALRSGALTLDELDELAIWRRARSEAGQVPRDRKGTKAVLNRLLKASLYDLVEATAARLAERRPADVEAVVASDQRLVAFSEERAGQHRELGKFLLERFYRHPRVTDSRRVAEEALATLVTHYLAHPEQLPAAFRERLDKHGPQRSVCDYVAGMTDRYALDAWHRLRGAATGTSLPTSELLEGDTPADTTDARPQASPRGDDAHDTAAPAPAAPGDPDLRRPSAQDGDGPPVGALEARIGHLFKDRGLAATALTHASARALDQDPNERLEFLGDTVLGLVVAEELYRRHPDQPEGELSRMKATTVSRHALWSVAEAWELTGLLSLGPGFREQDEVPPSVVADAVEAVLGAVYLDAGLDAVRPLVLEHFAELLETAAGGSRTRNAKSELQAFTQGRLGAAPHYLLLDESGPDHRKQFTLAAVVSGVRVAVASGRNKRQAEQRAARQGLGLLKACEARAAPGDDLLVLAAAALDAEGELPAGDRAAPRGGPSAESQRSDASRDETPREEARGDGD